MTAPGRKPPLFGSSISAALRNPLPLRSEQHGHYRDLFVDTGDLARLRSPDWQVVYGRRGTGKTFHLGVLEEMDRLNMVESRLLPVLITAQDCLVADTSPEVADKVRALGYFQTFIEILVDRILETVDRLLGKPTFLDSISGRRSRVEDKILELQVDLLNASRVGAPVAALAEYELVDEQSQTTNRDQRLGTEVTAGLGPRGPEGRLQTSVGFSANEAAARTNRLTLRTGATPRYALVRKYLLELLRTLEIRHLNVLIDEWQVLDPHASTMIQPWFAEYLKRTFAGSPLISVKIATNRYQTRFNNRGSAGSYCGLEPGADIFEAVNLDRAVLGHTELESFFRRLLFKRLLMRQPALRPLGGADGGDPDEQFILSIFNKEATFAELVRASAGIPRNFLILFNDLARRHQHRLDRQWTMADVRVSIRETSVENLDELDYHSEASQLLQTAVKNVVTRTGSRLFAVTRLEHRTLERALSELLEKRMIHEYPRAEFPGQLRNEYYAYLLDYGLWLDWQRERLRERTGLEDVMPDIEHAADLHDHLLDTKGLVQTTVICHQCDAVFPQDARSYVLQALCPECFRPARASRDAVG